MWAGSNCAAACLLRFTASGSEPAIVCRQQLCGCLCCRASLVWLQSASACRERVCCCLCCRASWICSGPDCAPCKYQGQLDLIGACLCLQGVTLLLLVLLGRWGQPRLWCVHLGVAVGLVWRPDTSTPCQPASCKGAASGQQGTCFKEAWLLHEGLRVREGCTSGKGWTLPRMCHLLVLVVIAPVPPVPHLGQVVTAADWSGSCSLGITAGCQQASWLCCRDTAWRALHQKYDS